MSSVDPAGFIVIHGHFYQPPRENPWLEMVEVQDSAYPYHDWNERVSAECYSPNAWSRALGPDGYVEQIVNNYARISFNFGPTLLSWLEQNIPETYQRILAADREGRERFSGHGPAMAQCYNHLIMPLASLRDKRTQVAWGIADFKLRFGREPEGMWLPETAVDIESLEVLAEHGIKFTVLAPRQAGAVRAPGGDWQDVSGEHIDPSRAYLQLLPSGRTIALFFYDGAVSRGVAFERLLNDGRQFAERLLDALPRDSGEPRLVNIATDGESYGHHHRFGDMALAAALRYFESSRRPGEPGTRAAGGDPDSGVRLTVYSEYLEKHPPTHEVKIIENTSWSCVHGVERWRSNCGCNTGAHPGWRQEWRGPLRDALDWLRDEAAAVFEREGPKYFADPWAARDAYIDVILDRSDASVAAFMASWALDGSEASETSETSEASEISETSEVSSPAPTRSRNPQVPVSPIKLLESQRHSLLMYTSCGWFFDELSGIETTQVLQYAGRVIHLVRELTDEDLTPEFLERLSKVKSNLREHGDGAVIYRKWIEPMLIGLHDAAAHFAVASLFDPRLAEVSGPAPASQWLSTSPAQGSLSPVSPSKYNQDSLEESASLTLTLSRRERGFSTPLSHAEKVSDTPASREEPSRPEKVVDTPPSREEPSRPEKVFDTPPSREEPSQAEKVVDTPASREEPSRGERVFDTPLSPWERVRVRASVFPVAPAFRVHNLAREERHLGRTAMAVGRAYVDSVITRESGTFTFGVLHQGDQNLTAGVRDFIDEARYGQLKERALSLFDSSDIIGVIRAFDELFSECRFSIKSLFRDERRRVLNRILDDAMNSARSVYSSIYEREAPMVRYLVGAGAPVPRPLMTSAELYFDTRLRQLLAGPDTSEIRLLLEEAQAIGAGLDEAGLGYLFSRRLREMLMAIIDFPPRPEDLLRIKDAVDLASAGPFRVDLWDEQNLYHEAWRRYAGPASTAPDPAWAEAFAALGESLHVRFELPPSATSVVTPLKAQPSHAPAA